MAARRFVGSGFEPAVGRCRRASCECIVYYSKSLNCSTVSPASWTIPPIVNYGDGGSWSDWTRSVDDLLKMDWDIAIPGHGPMVTKQQVRTIRAKMVAIQNRVRSMNRERKTQDDITKQLIMEFGWGTGPAAGNIAGMIQEFR